MAGNSRSIQEHKEHDKKSKSYGGSYLVKGKGDQFDPVISLWQGAQVCEFTHFLSYDYHAAYSSIDSEFNHEREGSYDGKNTTISSYSL